MEENSNKVLAALEAPVVGVNGSRAATTPGTFNAWLEANNGYRCDGGDCNNLVLEAPEALAGAPRLSANCLVSLVRVTPRGICQRRLRRRGARDTAHS